MRLLGYLCTFAIACLQMVSHVWAKPNIDRIAEEGVMLRNYYVQSVCSPTHAAFLTGRYPFRCEMEERMHGNDNAGMLKDERTVTQALKEAGYSTAIFVKWYLGQ